MSLSRSLERLYTTNDITSHDYDHDFALPISYAVGSGVILLLAQYITKDTQPKIAYTL